MILRKKNLKTINLFKNMEMLKTRVQEQRNMRLTAISAKKNEKIRIALNKKEILENRNVYIIISYVNN